MIASRTALAVLAAVALLLAAIIAFEPRRAPEDHSLAPGVDVGALTQLVVGGIAVEKDAKGWHRVDPPGPVDAATVDAVLSALRGGRWHRREPFSPDARWAPRGGVTAAGHKFAVGPELAGAGQTWIERDSDIVLVDNWVATALSPSPIDLAGRHPFAQPPKLDAGYRVDPAFMRERAAAYAALELVGLAPCTAGQSPAGGGCVAADRLGDLIGNDKHPPVDHRPVPFDPQRIELGFRATIDRTKRPQLDGKDADPDAVAELVAALAEPAKVAPLPAAKPTTTIAIHGAHDELILDLYDHVLARRGEPEALAPSPAAWATLMRPPQAYQDKTRWLEDAATISAIAIDGKTYHRGATLGTWEGARDPALLDALASALAMLRGEPGPAPTTIAHTIALTITPPVGTGKTHELKLGAHCAAIADGTPIVLPLAACTAVTAALAN